MVNALVQINEETNRTLNIIKAYNGLKDKGQAIEFLAKHSCPYCVGKTLKPEAIKRFRKAEAALDRGEGIRYGTLDEFNAHFDTIRAKARTKVRSNTRKTRAKSTKTS